MADAADTGPSKPDPFLKANILEALTEVVKVTYAGRGQRQKVLDEIIVANAQVIHDASLFLSFRDRLFKHSALLSAAIPPRRIPRLDPSLREQMEAWFKEDQALSQEQELVMGHIRSVLNASAHVEDYRLMLPDCLHDALKPFEDRVPEGTKRIAQEEIETVKARTFKGLLLLKQRMVLNLLD